jgi:hypothetical protein
MLAKLEQIKGPSDKSISSRVIYLFSYLHSFIVL